MQYTTNTMIWSIKATAKRLDYTDEKLIERISQMTGKSYPQPYFTIDKIIATIEPEHAEALKKALELEYADEKPTFNRMMAKSIKTAERAFNYDLSKGSLDWPHFNQWMKKKSSAKSPLYQCSIKQLASVITQLNQIIKHNEGS